MGNLDFELAYTESALGVGSAYLVLYWVEATTTAGNTLEVALALNGTTTTLPAGIAIGGLEAGINLVKGGSIFRLTNTDPNRLALRNASAEITDANAKIIIVRLD